MEGIRTKIGLIVPANNSVIEPELWRRAPSDVAFHATRILVRGDLTADAVRRMETHVERAVSELEATGVDVIAYADMVTSFIMPPDWNDRRTRDIEERTGISCLSAWTALREALNRIQPSGIALATPYPESLHALARPFFSANGYRVVSDATLDIGNMSEVAAISGSRLTDIVRSLDLSDASALVILATDLPTLNVIEDLERRFNLPVLSSNQSLLWASLARAGRNTALDGIGQLGRLNYC